jgi:hypothetical protein
VDSTVLSAALAAAVTTAEPAIAATTAETVVCCARAASTRDHIGMYTTSSDPVRLEKSDSAAEQATLGLVVDRHGVLARPAWPRCEPF